MTLVGRRTYTIVAVGDIMPGGALGEWVLREGVEKKQAELAGLLADADFVTGNLECPITDRAERRRRQLWNLKMSPALAPLLSPFHALALANNHILDFGAEGLADTLRVLTASGIRFCGAGCSAAEAGSPALFEADDFSFGMLAFTDPNWYPAGIAAAGTCSWRQEDAMKSVAALARQVDFVIVHLHRGYEFLDYPGPEELSAARQAIEAGADLVLCHHSHTLMGIACYDKAAVAYGLGNFLFDNIFGQDFEKVGQRALVRFQVVRHAVLGWEVIPLLSDERGWPIPAEGGDAAEILAHVKAAGATLSDETETVRRFRAQAATVMLPHAVRSLARLLRQEGLRAVLLRLKRLRWVDLTVLLARLGSPASVPPRPGDIDRSAS